MRRAYALLVVALVGALFVVAVVFNVAYTKRVAQQADRRQAEQRHLQDARWCALFATLDRPLTQPIKDPAQRQRTEQAVRLFHQLRVDLGCVKE